MSAALLTAEGLSKSYEGFQALRGVSLALDPGCMLALVGPNGAGKSTLFNILNGQLAPDAGSIRFRDKAIVGLSPDRIWRLGIGRTFQVAATFASMSVRENVQVALLSWHHRLAVAWGFAGNRYAAEADALLTLVGLQGEAARPSAELAYGDLKRLELAVALAGQPALLLMDEPTAGMAPGERHDLMRLVKGLTRERRLAVLFTEHDMDVVFDNADRMMVLNRGRVIAAGLPDDVRRDAAVRDTYLGAHG
jgi:branched-chain amino acid transport system ATP-binding protein